MSAHARLWGGSGAGVCHPPLCWQLQLQLLSSSSVLAAATTAVVVVVVPPHIHVETWFCLVSGTGCPGWAGSRVRVISGFGSGSITITRHPPGIPITTCHSLDQQTWPHNLSQPGSTNMTQTIHHYTTATSTSTSRNVVLEDTWEYRGDVPGCLSLYLCNRYVISTFDDFLCLFLVLFRDFRHFSRVLTHF